jgi:hypothetical protein
LYSDSTVLYCYASDVNDLEINLNEDLLKLAIWLNENKLTLNLNKTRSMIIGSDRKLCNTSSMSVSVNNTEVSNASNFKYLGVTITANFTWSEHIDRISTKVNQRLGLRRINHLLPFNARILVYNSLVLPIFDYADVIWGDKNNTVLMNNLQILQNKAAKIVLDRPIFSSATDALHGFELLANREILDTTTIRDIRTI